MSNELSKEEIIQLSHNWDYAYSDYQIESFVVNTGVVDYRKAKQCLIEIEQRQQSIEDQEFTIRKLDVEIEILKESLDDETSPNKRKLIEIEIEEKENFQKRNHRRLAGMNTEQQRFVDQFRKYATTEEDVKALKDNADEEERKYWIARMAKQGAMEMLSYGKIGTGNMESIMQMPLEDQEKVITGALDYTKKMETGIVALEKETEQNLIQQIKNNENIELIPLLKDSVAKDAKLLDSPKS